MFDLGHVGRSAPGKGHAVTDPGVYTGPTLDLDFTIGVLDPRITFTRAATGPATYFDVNGVLQNAGGVANTPRFDYDPVTHASRGLLIEETRTNIVINSQAINSWPIKTDCTITDNSVVSPDGLTDASLIVEGSAGTALFQSTPASGLVAGSAITYSAFVKKGSANDWLTILFTDTGATNGITVGFNLTTGALGTVAARGTSTGVSSSVQSIGNGWYRISASCTMPGTSTTCLVRMQSATTDSGAVRVNGATYYVWGVDAQVGSFLTSYIPTTAVAATRPTESANITPLGSWYNANAGTLKIEWDTFKPSTATGVSGGFSAGAFANTAYLSNATWNFIIATVAGNAIGSGLNQNNTTNKQVASYGAVAGVQVTNNGGAVATNATYTNANAPYPWTNLTFGSSPWSPVSNQINGHIRRGTYWNSALPALQMQQQSTL